MPLHKQCLILLASAFGFINIFIKDFKKDTALIARYEKELFSFIDAKDNPFSEFFIPLFHLYHLANKEDFEFKDQPFIFILNFFKFIFKNKEVELKSLKV